MTTIEQQPGDPFFHGRVLNTAARNASIDLGPLFEECSKLGLSVFKWDEADDSFKISVPLPSRDNVAAVKSALTLFPNVNWAVRDVQSNSGASQLVCQIGQTVRPDNGRYSAASLSQYFAESLKGKELLGAVGAAFSAAHNQALRLPARPLLSGVVCLERDDASATSDQLDNACAQLYTVSGSASLFLPLSEIPDNQLKEVLSKCGDFLVLFGEDIIHISKGAQKGLLVQVPAEHYMYLRQLATDELGLSITTRRDINPDSES